MAAGSGERRGGVIADDGGIRRGHAKLFDMFATANNARGDGRRAWAYCPCAAHRARPTAAPSPWRTTIPRAPF
ncbi:MAG: hypothetical protein ACLRIS_14940 [Flavonifractor plautii]